MTRPADLRIDHGAGPATPRPLLRTAPRRELSPGDPGWAQLRTSGGFTISVEEERQWQWPVWPATPGAHTSTQHLDLRIEDLAAAETWAVECGAVAAEFQPQDDVRVMIDPAGHPFCLFL